MDNLTNSLNEMIYHQRQAEQSTDANQQNYHHQEAMRYRTMAAKLDKQGRVIRQFIGSWLNLN